MIDLPALSPEFFDAPTLETLAPAAPAPRDPPRGRADYLVDRYSERKAEGRHPAAAAQGDTGAAS